MEEPNLNSVFCGEGGFNTCWSWRFSSTVPRAPTRLGRSPGYPTWGSTRRPGGDGRCTGTALWPSPGQKRGWGRKKKSLSLWERSGSSPLTMAWALVTIRLSAAWRNTSLRWTTAMTSESIKSLRTLPAPPRELIWVPHQDQLAAQAQGLDQRFKQLDVHHGHLIHHHCVKGEGSSGCLKFIFSALSSWKSTSNSRWMVLSQ